MLGSTNCERPGWMVRWIVAVFVPSNDTNDAVAVVWLVPRFWMMNGVWKPKNRRTMFGRKTLVAPPVAPVYEAASARLAVPACSFTTPTIGAMKDWATTENWELSGRSLMRFGTRAYDVPGRIAQASREAMRTPSLKR